MPLDLYAEELELERGMLQYGEDRYKRELTNAKEQGRASETSYARRLTSTLCNDMSELLGAWIRKTSPGKGANARVVLRKLEPEQASYITLKTIFDSLIREESLLTVALLLGQRIEDQIRFKSFQEENPDLYNFIIQEFQERNVVNYRRKHRVLVNAHSRQVEWKGLNTNQRAQLGTILIEHAITATGLFDTVIKQLPGGKSTRVLFATTDTLDWIEEHISRFSLLYPDFSPTVIPPKPWTSMNSGGYYLSPLQRRFPFVKAKTIVQRDGIKGHDFSTAMKAVNKIQETPWRINQFVLNTMQEVWRRNLRIGMPPSQPFEIPPCPYPKEMKKGDMNEDELAKFLYWKKECSDLYTLEKQRVSKCLLLGRIMSSAVRYSKYEQMYFVYNCDFRGRIYAASSGFSPQGPDLSKGILEFAEGKALGQTGFNWLCIHGANCYGIDKVSFNERVAWCKERKELLIEIGTDPFSERARKVWQNADEPYQFLAFCREYKDAVNDPIGYVSHLPIALDGSCNGLQHFSAMLRDEVGGKAVNLVPSDKPEDIYAEVAIVCNAKLNELVSTDNDPDGHAHKAVVFGINRKITKAPVMTIVYGSTLNNCLKRTTEYILEHPETSTWGTDVYKGAVFTGKVIWASIDDVIIAAKAAMQYLRKVSGIVSKLNKPLVFYSPSGFKVFQSIMLVQSKIIKTQLLGTVMLKIVEDTEDVNANKQANGISPNFVHSLDAAHLCLTVNATDFSAYAMIHDSFGTHACNTDELAKVLREEFIQMYTEHDVLLELKETLEEEYNIELPQPPFMGNLDLQGIRESKYFFG